MAAHTGTGGVAGALWFFDDLKATRFLQSLCISRSKALVRRRKSQKWLRNAHSNKRCSGVFKKAALPPSPMLLHAATSKKTCAKIDFVASALISGCYRC